ncbi:MAG: MerR family DNA-binding protein [Bacillota bacterium]
MLLLRELDFTLAEIRKVLNRPDFDRLKWLRRHRELLQDRKERLEAIIDGLTRP